jgi:ubiquinone/menaquinone biosynthesis C-methylase UbiE
MKFTNQKIWEESFKDQVKYSSYNTAPVDVIVRNVSYYLRARFNSEQINKLKFLEIGCGAGVNLAWLAKKGVQVSGIDISEEALDLAKQKLQEENIRYDSLVHTSATNLPFEDDFFSGVVESCVVQHISEVERSKVFSEIYRVLKPGGVFIGHMLDRDCTAFEVENSDKGSMIFEDSEKPKFYLTNIGYAHFFSEEELRVMLKSFSVIDISKATFYLPLEEAKRRGHEKYKQSMWSVYAIK